ncbi:MULTISPECIES: ParA family protein [Methanobacterium]|uniref:Sporulation initiation inhibitor Soj n=1 Tax=Methanobacterium bryantii TaxID=2161 RepID=A0A2A2H8F7_METBR|nr:MULTISPECIES: ParA family protein [Methanobacterium]OEC86217.1 sporulation initiation inhibitor Soj [Methanobacterium sp. A39]PAV05668.1 sporulation initiation inhibitor Soj [Methanobacterium bryantii]
MAEIIAVLNQKGGSGKTTTAVNLATALAKKGKKIALVDFDPQGNATTYLGLMKREMKNTMRDVLHEKIDAKDAVRITEYDGLELIPSNIKLSGIEGYLNAQTSPISVLKSKLKNIKEDYDYIFIDAPPTLNIIATNVLTAADSVIIPIQADPFALEGMVDLLEVIDIIAEDLNSPTEIKGVLITKFRANTKLGKEVKAEVQKYFKNELFKTTIPDNIKVSEAPGYNKPVIVYDPDCAGSKAYIELADEFLARENNE